MLEQEEELSNSFNQFCENILNYRVMYNIKNPHNRKTLLALSNQSLEKYKNMKDSIYYRRAYILQYIFRELVENKLDKKSYKFFFRLINQPYLNEYLLPEKRKLIAEFVQTDNLYKTILYIKSVTQQNRFEILTLKILKDHLTVCMAPRYFFTYNLKEIDEINKSKTIKYNTQIFEKYGFGFLTDVNVEVISKIRDNRPILTEKLKTGGLARLWASTRFNMIANDCIEKAKKGLVKFIYYGVGWLIEKIPQLKVLEPSPHKSAVILDFTKYEKTKTVDVLFMETSISEDKKELWLEAEIILIDSIKNDIEINFGLKCNIVTFDLENCPRIDIQGSAGTCAIWSLYIFYLYIFYPSRKTIYSILREIEMKSRNSILLVFIFFVYMNFKKDIEEQKTLTRYNEIEDTSNYLKNSSTILKNN